LPALTILLVDCCHDGLREKRRGLDDGMEEEGGGGGSGAGGNRNGSSTRRRCFPLCLLFGYYKLQPLKEE